MYLTEGLWRTRSRLWLLACLLVVTAATCNPPGASTSTARETVGPDNTPEFADGPLHRQVAVMVPAGAMEGAKGGSAGMVVSTKADPFSAVEFVMTGPVEARVVIDEPGNEGFRFDWTLPTDCEQGCEVVVPVTITHIGDGDLPRFSWSMSFTIAYETVAPDLEPGSFLAEIKPAEN